MGMRIAPHFSLFHSLSLSLSLSLLPHSQKRSTDALPSARERALIVTSLCYDFTMRPRFELALSLSLTLSLSLSSRLGTWGSLPGPRSLSLSLPGWRD